MARFVGRILRVGNGFDGGLTIEPDGDVTVSAETGERAFPGKDQASAWLREKAGEHRLWMEEEDE